MGEFDIRPCPCGSGLDSQWQRDGRGIPLCRTYKQCHKKKMAQYRPEILDYYTQADVDEQIEESD